MVSLCLGAGGSNAESCVAELFPALLSPVKRRDKGKQGRREEVAGQTRALRRCHWRFFGMPVAWSSPLFCPIFQLAGAPLPRCRRKCTGGAAVAEAAKLSPPPCHSKRAGNVSARRGRGAGLAYVKPVPNEKRGGSIALPPLFWTVCGDDFANRSLLAFGAAKRAVFPSAESATPARCIFLPLFLPCRKSRTG